MPQSGFSTQEIVDRLRLAETALQPADKKDLENGIAAAQSAASNAQATSESAEAAVTEAQSAASAAQKAAESAAEQAAENASALTIKAPYIEQTVSGSIASFDDGADGIPVKSMTVNIEPVQEGEGDPSPENVRPIRGWTGVNIANVNVAPDESKVYEIEPIQEGEGDPSPDNATTFTVDWESEAGTVYGGTLDVTTGLLTVTWGKRPVRSDNGSWSIYISSVGSEYPCFFGRNLVGRGDSGSINLLCNAMTAKNLDYLIRGLAQGVAGHPTAGNDLVYMALANSLLGTSTASTTDELYSAFMNYLDNHDVYFVYRLAGSIAYQLTPLQVTTLLGQNNIFADTGDVSVTYRTDPTIAYNKLTAAILSLGGNV